MVGSNARRRGRVAARQRRPRTSTVARQAPSRSDRWVVSIALAICSSGKASRRFGSSSSANSSHTNPRISSGSTNANTSSLSTVDSSRPAVSSDTSSATKKTLQRSTSQEARVVVSSESS